MPRAIPLFILTGLVFAAPAAAQRAGKSDFDFSNFGSTPWIQWRLDLGTRF